jgi:hypothetical protein
VQVYLLSVGVLCTRRLRSGVAAADHDRTRDGVLIVAVGWCCEASESHAKHRLTNDHRIKSFLTHLVISTNTSWKRILKSDQHLRIVIAVSDLLPTTVFPQCYPGRL